MIKLYNTITQKKIYVRLLICIVIALIFSVCVESFFHIGLLRNRTVESKSISLEDIQTEYFDFTGHSIRKVADDAYVRISFDEPIYIGKLIFHYKSTNPMLYEADIQLHQETVRYLRNITNILRTFAVLNINHTVDHIDLHFDKDQNIEIFDFTIDNSLVISPWRISFLFVLMFLLSFIVLFAANLLHKEENFFLMASLLIGIIVIVSLPPHKTGWDEEIHFERAYAQSFILQGKTTMYNPPLIQIYRSVGHENFPTHNPNTIEEGLDMYRIFNEIDAKADPNDPSNYQSVFKVYDTFYEVSAPGWFTQALFLLIGRLLGLPFVITYQLGRFGNLLQYAIVGFFAIRHMKYGKRLMLAILLMPTTLFLATVYSYDATVNVFLALGISYFVGLMTAKEGEASKKELIIMAFALTFGSLPKAVFGPLLLISFLIPADKFKTNRGKIIFRTSCVLLTLFLLSTFVVPSLLGTPSMVGDDRVGGTNMSRQFEYIFSYPMVYTKLLLTSMVRHFIDFTIGSSSFGIIGHGITHRLSILPGLFLVFVAVTEKGCYRFKVWKQIFIGLILFGICSLIWTALYLDFTPVGEDSIWGVQGRYFIPLTMIFLLLLNLNLKFGVKYEKIYNTLLFSGLTVMAMGAFYITFVANWL